MEYSRAVEPKTLLNRRRHHLFTPYFPVAFKPGIARARAAQLESSSHGPINRPLYTKIISIAASGLPSVHRQPADSRSAGPYAFAVANPTLALFCSQRLTGPAPYRTSGPRSRNGIRGSVDKVLGELSRTRKLSSDPIWPTVTWAYCRLVKSCGFRSPPEHLDDGCD